MVTLSHVRRTLADLRRGERAWFWFCENTAALSTPFVIVPIADDPAMDTLTEVVMSFRMPDDARECFGLAHCDERGVLHMGSADVTETMLPALAGWVKENVTDFPDFGRLAKARFVRYDEDYKITDVFEDDTLWDGVDPVDAPGGIGDAAAALRSLEPGQRAWLWAVDKGPEGTPFAVIVPEEDDPDAETFGLTARQARGRSARTADFVTGIIQILDTGKLVVTTTDPIDDVQALVGVLATIPGLERLDGGVVLVKAEDGFSEGGALSADDLTRMADLLRGLEPGNELFIWISPEAKTGLPSVVVDDDKETVKTIARERTKAKEMLIGSVLVGDDGTLELHARRTFPKALVTLALWTRTFHPGWDAFARFADARVVHDGEIEQDPTLWTFLTDGGV